MSNQGTTEDQKIFNHQLGKNIKYLRKQKGFTQERLSRNLRRNGKVCKQTVDKTKKSARIRYV